jgi:hypothetical protein
MSRRNLIPLALLAVLAVLTAVFAVVGAASAPTATNIEVQNATDKTLGMPTGANSWIMVLVTSVHVGAGSGGGTTQERIVKYVAPDQMTVFDVSGGTARFAGGVRQPACVLSFYAAMLGGNASWQEHNGGRYTRTESLADYTARVPVPGPTGSSTCEPVPSTVQGQVYQTAVVRSGYLVTFSAHVVIPAHGTQDETQSFVRIGDVVVRTLK